MTAAPRRVYVLGAVAAQRCDIDLGPRVVAQVQRWVILEITAHGGGVDLQHLRRRPDAKNPVAARIDRHAHCAPRYERRRMAGRELWRNPSPYNLSARYNRRFIHRLRKARSPYDAQDDYNL